MEVTPHNRVAPTLRWPNGQPSELTVWLSGCLWVITAQWSWALKPYVLWTFLSEVFLAGNHQQAQTGLLPPININQKPETKTTSTALYICIQNLFYLLNKIIFLLIICVFLIKRARRSAVQHEKILRSNINIISCCPLLKLQLNHLRIVHTYYDVCS